MADAGAGRHHAEVVERVLTPFQEGQRSMLRSYSSSTFFWKARGAEFVDHDRVVDDQIDRAPAG